MVKSLGALGAQPATAGCSTPLKNLGARRKVKKEVESQNDTIQFKGRSNLLNAEEVDSSLAPTSKEMGLSRYNETRKVWDSSNLLKKATRTFNENSTRKRLMEIFTLQASQKASDPSPVSIEPMEDHIQLFPKKTSQQRSPFQPTPQHRAPTGEKGKCPDSFRWTPKNIRSIIQNEEKTDFTCMSPTRVKASPVLKERKKKKHPGAGDREKEKLRQLTILEMRGVDDHRDCTTEVARVPTPPGAASSTRY